MHQQQTYTAQYLGERLLHFWRDEPESQAFDIFQSIVDCGLLLSRGHGALVDRFSYNGKDGHEQFVHLNQKPRCCFTDIPEDKLSHHTLAYGRCAVGFERQTILEWGGSPVLYLANHRRLGTLQETAGSVLRLVDDSAAILAAFAVLCETGQVNLKLHNEQLGPSPTAAHIEQCRQALFHFLSYVKEMSPKGADTHDFLREREWRIVSGISLSASNPFRALKPNERAKLVARVPAWGEHMRRSDGQICEPMPLIDSFQFFNGLSGQSVSKSIVLVLTPSSAFKERVDRYVAQWPEKFRDGGPEVRVLRD